MRPPFLPPGWFQVPDLVGTLAGGLLPGKWTASLLVRAINDGTFPKPVPIPNCYPLVGWPRGVVANWIAAHTTPEE